jgi:coxsackievirus/adenovirus receptor
VCYNVVQEHVNILRRLLRELRLIIENIGDSSAQPVDDADFRRQLKAVNVTVYKLWQDARRFSGVDTSVAEQVEAIRTAIDDLMNTFSHITHDITESSHGAETAKLDTAAAERAVDNAERALREAERRLKTEGQNALKQAIDAQRQFGQQSDRMTQISREAREHADKQTTDSSTIEEKAKEALNTSNEAYRIAQEAIQKPATVTSEIDIIRRSITDVEKLYTTTKRVADSAQSQAQEAYSDALSVYTQADTIRITTINIDSLQSESNQIKSEAGDIKDEANRLINQHESLMTDVERQTKEATELLDDGTRQQQVTDELLADADAARDVARKAVNKAENTLREARETLRILKEFDQTVRDSKSKADEALKKIPEIERMISDAERKTQEAHDNLHDAERNALEAKDIAELAQQVSEGADLESRNVRNRTSITSVQATSLIEHNEALTIDIDEIERRLAALEQRAEEDEQLAKAAIEKADQARTSANTASSKVSGGLNTVNQILQQLASLERIDSARLDELEVNLTLAQQKLANARIESRYSELEQLSTQTTTWIYDYSSQLAELTRDVENIRVINMTIPRDCFRKITLEPADPSAG